ncbi:MAG: ANTAR domain-containing protein [Bryobacteraceae bacterium]|nr:ANTAR domain-containing protein [Bryobacteraceae bacterium]MDW8379531.1 ANTAR domain-containing protein [Bryobacterales bacterium]
MSVVSPEPLASQVGLLHRISSIVSSELSLDEMLGEILGLTVQASGCDACLVYLLDSSTQEIVLRASQLPHAKALGKLRMKMGEGITGWVAEHKSVVALSSNAGKDPRFKRFPSLIEDTYEAFISVPLISGGDIVGVINVHYRAPREHDPQLLAMLSFIGEQMGGAIAKSILAEENRRLQQEALEMKRQLEARKLIERAKGILMQRHKLTEEEAYLKLRNDSRRSRRAMRDLAEQIIQQEVKARQAEAAAASEAAASEAASES